MKLTPLESREIQRYAAAFDFCHYLQDKHFLLTGSNGMTGNALIRFLLYLNDKHNLNLRLFASTRHPEQSFSYLDKNDPVIALPFGREAEFLKDEKIDFIIHMAAPTGRAFFVERPVETIRTIVDETEAMLELAKQKKVASFLYLSSVEAYGAPTTGGALKESYCGAVDQTNIRNCYPLGKKTAEFLCIAYGKEYQVPVKIVRPSSIQGLFQPYVEDRVFNQILRCVIEKKNLVLRTKGDSKKSFVYTLDAVTGILFALLKGTNGEAYNLTNPATFLTIRDLAETVFSWYAPNLGIDFALKSESETGYLPAVSFTQDISKLSLLGWRPITGLKEIYSVDIERFQNEKERC